MRLVDAFIDACMTQLQSTSSSISCSPSPNNGLVSNLASTTCSLSSRRLTKLVRVANHSTSTIISKSTPDDSRFDVFPECELIGWQRCLSLLSRRHSRLTQKRLAHATRLAWTTHVCVASSEELLVSCEELRRSMSHAAVSRVYVVGFMLFLSYALLGLHFWMD